MGARLLRIRRAIDWIGRTLIADRDAFTSPQGFWDTVSPTIDAFGASRMAEVQFAQVLGPLGGLEAVHTRVPADRVRHYLAMEFSHDDIGFLRAIRPGRIVTTDQLLFPFVGIDDQRTLAAAQQVFAVRNVVVPPLGWIGARVNPIGAGARITLRVLWMEYPVGEYPVGVS